MSSRISLDAILAASIDKVIGVNGQLPWNIPEDMKYFKTITKGRTIVMGRKTWESLPIRPLPGRKAIVVSTKASFLDSDKCTIAASDDRLIDILTNTLSPGDQNPILIGGSSLYDRFLPRCSTIYYNLIQETVLDKVSPSDSVTTIGMTPYNFPALGFSVSMNPDDVKDSRVAPYVITARRIS